MSQPVLLGQVGDDRPAVELALRLREDHGGKITALSMGPDSALPALYDCLSMGVDQAVLLSDPAFKGSDTLATSTALGGAINKLPASNLILFGVRTSDSDTGQVGPQTATLLELPIVTNVNEIECKSKVLIVERKSDEFVEKYEITLPAVLTIHPGAVQPRDLTLMGIEAAFGYGDVTKMSLSDINIPVEIVGESGSPTRIVSMNTIIKERKCDFIDGHAEEQAEEIVKYLKGKGFIG